MVEQTSFLYVEDDPRSRDVMQIMMTRAMRVGSLEMFEDSADFLAKLNGLAHNPDIILLDIHIEPYDGFDMLKMIRERPEYKGAKVIALTASVMNEEVEALRAKGFDGAIAKPLSMSSFPRLIERIIAGESVWHIV